jgi:hypothetical protein
MTSPVGKAEESGSYANYAVVLWFQLRTEREVRRGLDCTLHLRMQCGLIWMSAFTCTHTALVTSERESVDRSALVLLERQQTSHTRAHAPLQH